MEIPNLEDFFWGAKNPGRSGSEPSEVLGFFSEECPIMELYELYHDQIFAATLGDLKVIYSSGSPLSTSSFGFSMFVLF